MFNVNQIEKGQYELRCHDKFGDEVTVQKRQPMDVSEPIVKPDGFENISYQLDVAISEGNSKKIVELFYTNGLVWDYNTIRWVISELARKTVKNKNLAATVIEALTFLLDRRFPLGDKKRSALVSLVNDCLNQIFRSLPKITETVKIGHYSLIEASNRIALRPPIAVERILVVDAKDFDPYKEP
jgi:hypothetical protein